MSNFALIKAFHDKFDPAGTGESYASLLPRRLKYLTEETRETAEACDTLLNLTAGSSSPATTAPTPEIRAAKMHLVQELVDVLQVTYGFLHLMGVDADAAYAEVIRANMSKTPNPGGKAIKGPEFKPANMEQFV